jgi:hypothetical protein
MDAIDLNCDLGESFGAWTMGSDADMLDVMTSANVACSFHAGDPLVMVETVARQGEGRRHRRGSELFRPLRLRPPFARRRAARGRPEAGSIRVRPMAGPAPGVTPHSDRRKRSPGAFPEARDHASRAASLREAPGMTIYSKGVTQ